MNPTNQFDQVNKIYGWGDPGSAERPGIWFFGIEEAGCWPEEASTNVDLERLVQEATKELNVKCHELRGSPFEPVSQLSDKDKKSRVYQYSSKIACTLLQPNQCNSWKDSWREYRDNVLYREGSSVCNANLSPLGKANTGYWPPHYTRLFGLTEKEYREYRDKAGCGERFKAMHELWVHSHPMATICYWGSKWLQYAEWLGWEKANWEEINSEKDILCSKELRIIITPHFSRGMSNRKVEAILDQINSWKAL